VYKLKSLALAIPVQRYFKMGHVTWPRPFRDGCHL